MTPEQIQFKLVYAVTEYDRKQSRRKGYNSYALAHYIGRAQDIAADMARGADPRQAIIGAFCGGLVNVCLKAIGEPKATEQERDGGAWFYQPQVQEAK